MIKFGVVFDHKDLLTWRSMKISKITILVLPVVLLAASCHKIEKLSAIPSIKFTSFTIFDTTDILGNDLKAGRLRFTFEDGDGNVGLKTPSNDFADSTNLFFTLYRKTNGVLVPATVDDPLYPSAYRIPYMEREGQNKILRGTISVTFLYLFYEPTDTIKYDFYIMDRDENESNVATTNEIAIAHDGMYKK
jgi:hypothetical protein